MSSTATTPPLSSLGLNENQFTLYRIDDPYTTKDGKILPFIMRRCYEVVYEGEIVTLAIYNYQDQEILRAWGYKNKEHCSYYAISNHDGVLVSYEGCPSCEVSEMNDDMLFTLEHNGNRYVWSKTSFQQFN
jgi:hypothetical protein